MSLMPNERRTAGCSTVVPVVVLLLALLCANIGSSTAVRAADFSIDSTQPAPSNTITVSTPYGELTGLVDSVTETFQFWNVPFAQPPLNSFRWKPPQPIDRFPSSPYRADNASLRYCVQPLILVPTTGSEDCLYFHVIVPSSAPPTGGFPVYVQIHGGAFFMQDFYNLTQWVGRAQAFIGVTLQYRLGAFGFLAFPALSAENAAAGLSRVEYSGNQGLQDQQEALRVLTLLLPSLGGNRSSITLSGQSAGAYSICYHLLMPASQGLFHAAIIQSGGCESVFVILTLAQMESKVWTNIFDGSHCASLPAGVDQLSCFRNLSALDVLALQSRSSTTGIIFFWRPIVDGVVLPAQSFASLFAAGQYASVPLIVGSVSGELEKSCLSNGPDFPYNYTQQDVDNSISFQLMDVDGHVNSTALATLSVFYSRDNYVRLYNVSDINVRIVDAAGSRGFYQCPARLLLPYPSRKQQRAWHVIYDYVQVSNSDAWTTRPSHIEDQFILYNMSNIARPFISNSEDSVMTAQLQMLFTRFVVSHDPNVDLPAVNQRFDPWVPSIQSTLINWPAADGQSLDQALHILDREKMGPNASITDHFTLMTAPYKDQCEGLWQGFLQPISITPRLAPCQTDECSTSADVGNVCINQYNGSYVCQCAGSWQLGPNGASCQSMGDGGVVLSSVMIAVIAIVFVLIVGFVLVLVGWWIRSRGRTQSVQHQLQEGLLDAVHDIPPESLEK